MKLLRHLMSDEAWEFCVYLDSRQQSVMSAVEELKKGEKHRDLCKAMLQTTPIQRLMLLPKGSLHMTDRAVLFFESQGVSSDGTMLACDESGWLDFGMEALVEQATADKNCMTDVAKKISWMMFRAGASYNKKVAAATAAVVRRLYSQYPAAASHLGATIASRYNEIHYSSVEEFYWFLNRVPMYAIARGVVKPELDQLSCHRRIAYDAAMLNGDCFSGDVRAEIILIRGHDNPINMRRDEIAAKIEELKDSGFLTGPFLTLD